MPQPLPHEYVFELKYLQQAEDEGWRDLMSQAKAQLSRYLQADPELQGLPLLHAVAVVAVKDKVYWEAL